MTYRDEGTPVNRDVHPLRRMQDLTPVRGEMGVFSMRRNPLTCCRKRLCGKHLCFEMGKSVATGLDESVDFVRAKAQVDAGPTGHSCALNAPGEAAP